MESNETEPGDDNITTKQVTSAPYNSFNKMLQ